MKGGIVYTTDFFLKQLIIYFIIQAGCKYTTVIYYSDSRARDLFFIVPRTANKLANFLSSWTFLESKTWLFSDPMCRRITKN